MRITKDRGLSWKLRIGVDGNLVGSGSTHDGVFSFGTGRAWKPTDQLTGLGLLHLEVHTQGTFARIRPELRLFTYLGNLRATIGFDLMSTGYGGDFLGRGNWRFLYRLSETQSIEAQHRNGSDITTVGISRYF